MSIKEALTKLKILKTICIQLITKEIVLQNSYKKIISNFVKDQKHQIKKKANSCAKILRNSFVIIADYTYITAATTH